LIVKLASLVKGRRIWALPGRFCPGNGDGVCYCY